MLLYPPVEELLKKFDNPYKLAVVVGKRAKALSQVLTEEEKQEMKAVSRAIKEAYDGKISS